MRLLTLLPQDKPESIDRYQLVGEIASGGMASVYLARLAGAGGFKRLVAIKRLHPHLANEQDFVEMFLDEARFAAAIHHRNVVPIVEIGNTDAGFYLVMEYIEGVTLSRLAGPGAQQKEPVPRKVLLRVMIDGLSGLHASHELVDEDGTPLELVHRDCSPQNLLVGLDGCTRLTDFGVAKARVRIHKTAPGAVKGKIIYMAPELASGDDFDRRADLFSMGVVLWEILAGQELFEGDNEVVILNQLLTEPIARLDKIDPTIPKPIADVVARALQRNPSERFATAAEMAAALEEAAKAVGEEIASERAVEAYMTERFGARADRQRAKLREWFQGAALPEPRSGLDQTQLAAQDKPRRMSLTEHQRLQEEASPAPRRPFASQPAHGNMGSVPPGAVDREATREIEAAVSSALSRRGIGGIVVLRDGAIELRGDDGGPPVAIEVGEWVSQWNLLPPDMRDRRAESAAVRLQSAAGGGSIAPPMMTGNDPVARAYAREAWRNRILTVVVAAAGLMGIWWLWSAGFFGDTGEGGTIPAFPGFADEPVPTASAAAYEQTGARVRRACEVARQQLLAGQALSVDVEGWVVELWLATGPEVEGLASHRALTRLVKEGAVGELGVQAPGKITLHGLDVPGSKAVLVRLDGGYAVKFFQKEGRDRYLGFAQRLMGSVKASHAGLYARCAHMPGRDVGAWFAGHDRAAALAALLWTTGEEGSALTSLQKDMAALEADAIEGALRSVGGREMVSGKGKASTVALRFPLGGAASATKAGRKLREPPPGK